MEEVEGRRRRRVKNEGVKCGDFVVLFISFSPLCSQLPFSLSHSLNCKSSFPDRVTRYQLLTESRLNMFQENGNEVNKIVEAGSELGRK